MKITAWFVQRFHYYVVFSKPILFISGLIFSYSLVESSLFSTLINHLSDMWKDDYSIPKLALVVNLYEGACEVLQIFLTYAADAYTGLFPMLLCSTTVGIIGLCLCFITSHWVFYIALVLMTLSQAATNITLKAFLGDQLLAMDRDRPTTEEEKERALTTEVEKERALTTEEKEERALTTEVDKERALTTEVEKERALTTEEKEERAHCRIEFWWIFLTLLAAIASFSLSVSHFDSNFQRLLLGSAIAMGVGFLWFLLGTKLYTCNKPTGSPLTDVLFVIYAAITNRNSSVPYPKEILPQISWLRWLDKAAVVADDREKQISCSVGQVKGVKFLLKMIPLWTTFFAYGLVEATGSTFFLVEANKINAGFPVLFFIFLQSFTHFIVARVSDYITEKLEEKNNKVGQKLMLLRIGMGMISCVLCCIFAWINALHWYRLPQKYSYPGKHHMAIFRLIPQYLSLGVMGGLSEDGLENFFDSQVSKSISRYGPPFGKCVMGFGKFLSAICTLFFSAAIPWINDDINSSHLDRYYAVLAVFSLVNMIIFWILAYWYGDERFFPEGQKESENSNFDSVEALEEEQSSFEYNVTENTSSEQSQLQEDSAPLLNLKTGQEKNVSSSSMVPKDEAAGVNRDVLMGNQAQSFSYRPSSKGIKKRLHSMP